MSKDAANKDYFGDAIRVADILNGFHFHGKKIIHPEDVKEADGYSSLLEEGKESSDLIKRYHDTVFKIVRGANCLIIGLEKQNYIDPAMVLRVFEYTAGQYEKQRREIRKQHERESDLQGDEYISNFSFADRLKPVVIIVIYFGDKPWRGARTLHELLDWTDIPEEWHGMFMDFQMHLLEVNKIEDLEMF